MYLHDRLILIAEKMKVYQQFPIPLINRMEKHFVFTENVLTRAQIQISTEISDWISKFSKVAASYVGPSMSHEHNNNFSI